MDDSIELLGILLLAFCAVCILVCFGMMGYEVWFHLTHHCTSWSVPYFHPGHWFSTGKTMMYVPGETRSDCLSWAKN